VRPFLVYSQTLIRRYGLLRSGEDQQRTFVSALTLRVVG
jgi:hypothetical protein